MLTIVHIINGLEAGGAETTMFGLCTQDNNNKHIVISLLDQGKYLQPLLDRGFEVHCLNLKGQGWLLPKLFHLYRLLRRIKPDIVQTWMYHSDLIGGVIARLAAVQKVSWGVHNTILTPALSKRSTIFISRLCRYLSYIVPHQIICCADKSLSVHAGLGYKASIMQVINNGYDVSRFTPDKKLAAEFLQDITHPEGHLLLGCVGRFDPNKDHKNLLDALVLLKSSGLAFNCVLVGNQMTADNTVLWQMIEQRKLQQQVLLLGQRNDIPAVMNALDIHVLSSVAEAFPNVLCEAMACGTPCVTTDVGDAATIVAETGWVVPAGDPQMLADTIQLAAEQKLNDVLWQERCLAARVRIVQQFSADKMVAAYQSAWSANL